MTITPEIVVEIAMAVYDPSTTDYFVLDFDTLDGAAVLGAGTAFTDVSEYVRSFSVRRGRQRSTEQFATGTATLVLDNRDARFDPLNLTGPYASGGVTGVIPMRPIRVSAVYNGITYRLFTGFIDTWTFDYSPGLSDATATLACSDGLKFLASADGRLAQVAATQNAAALATVVTVTSNQNSSSTSGTEIVVGTSGVSTVVNGTTSTETFTAAELAGTRMQKILNNAGWPSSLRIIDVGKTTIAAGQEVSGSILGQMQDVNAAELGQVFINVRGELVFRERYSERLSTESGTSKGTFSQTSAASLPYQSLTFAYKDDQIKNQIVVNRVGNSTVFQIQDDVSVALYGLRTEELSDLLVTTSGEARQIGQLYLALYAAAEYFPEQMTLVPEAKPANLYPQVLDRDLRDRITVSFTAPGGVVRSVDCLVDGIEHSVSPGQWTTTYSLTSTTTYDQFFVLDSATSGVLDTNTLAA